MLEQGVQRVGHVLVAQVPGVDSPAEHRAVVDLGVANGLCVALGNKTLVIDAFDTLFNKRDYAAAEWFWSPKYIQHSAYIHPDVRARST